MPDHEFWILWRNTAPHYAIHHERGGVVWQADILKASRFNSQPAAEHAAIAIAAAIGEKVKPHRITLTPGLAHK